MGILSTWADKQSPYIKLADGDSFVAEYIGAKIVDDRFNPGKTTVEYTFIRDGEEKIFKNSSAGVARIFDKLHSKSLVKVTRAGEGPQTRYSIKEVKDTKGEVSKEEADAIDEVMAG